MLEIFKKCIGDTPQTCVIQLCFIYQHCLLKNYWNGTANSFDTQQQNILWAQIKWHITEKPVIPWIYQEERHNKTEKKHLMKKFTHAMAKFDLLQITVLSLIAGRLLLTWFCAQGTQKDVQRPCTCQMQYTNVGQCARYKLSLHVKCIRPHASITCVIWCVYHRFNLAIRIG